MSIYVDRKYLNLVSHRLKKFKRKNDDLYNFRCPLCGDSQKNQSKARGYIYRKRNDLFFKCHNCGSGTTMANLIKKLDSEIYSQYSMEKYRDGAYAKNNKHIGTEKPDFQFEKPVFKKRKELELLKKISELSDDHIAKQFVLMRKIPKEYHGELYYADDFREFVENTRPDKSENLKNDKRLIIPFFDENKELFAYQGRALNPKEQMRYITIILNENKQKIYGLDKLDPNKHIYVTEGPIDSMFIDNCVAYAGSTLSKVDFSDTDKCTFIYDNERRNKEILKQMEKMINKNFQLFVWPENMIVKDINELVINGYDKSQIMNLINNNTYGGLSAKLKILDWKRC